ncbi:hypothetical protein [Streptomyces sp. H27-D2]|uniref:hypothetical protein n=1 Tax=Streptomyces sp. H27-D2 TaxID=3046304 RepID=UPI002DBFE215|nr:hypothetical protein [Streptomyces sp. H27-D2]MEC4018867.1 hypothetical protein [Streptomyces sp. H27-D2]
MSTLPRVRLLVQAAAAAVDSLVTATNAHGLGSRQCADAARRANDAVRRAHAAGVTDKEIAAARRR